MIQKIVDTIQKICEKDEKFNFISFNSTRHKTISFSINTKQYFKGSTIHEGAIIIIDDSICSYLLFNVEDTSHRLSLDYIKDSNFLEHILSIFMNKVYELFVLYLTFIKNLESIKDEVELLIKPQYIRDLKINELLK